MIVLLSQTKLPDSSNPLSDIVGAVHNVAADNWFVLCHIFACVQQPQFGHTPFEFDPDKCVGSIAV